MAGIRACLTEVALTLCYASDSRAPSQWEHSDDLQAHRRTRRRRVLEEWTAKMTRQQARRSLKRLGPSAPAADPGSLSHDMIEGARLGCGGIFEASVFHLRPCCLRSAAKRDTAPGLVWAVHTMSAGLSTLPAVAAEMTLAQGTGIRRQ